MDFIRLQNIITELVPFVHMWYLYITFRIPYMAAYMETMMVVAIIRMYKTWRLRNRGDTVSKGRSMMIVSVESALRVPPLIDLMIHSSLLKSVSMDFRASVNKCTTCFYSYSGFFLSQLQSSREIGRL